MARIVYLTYPANEVAGGIKIAFRHVETLRAAGFNAVIGSVGAVVPTWFETTAPLVDLNTLLPEDDVLVFPENHHPLLVAYAKRPNPKLVFCQNQYYVLKGLGGPGPTAKRNYADFGVSGIMCSSRSVADYCMIRFPAMPLAIVPVGVDQTLFTDTREKRLQIAFAPSKRPLEAGFIWDLFRAKFPEFAKVPWVPIQGLSEKQVAKILGESAVKLALCRFESLSLTILEAMLSGCVTVGFTGFGAREFTTSRNGFWAEEDDCLQCVELLAQALRLTVKGGPVYGDLLQAAKSSASYYTHEKMCASVVAFWQDFQTAIFSKPPVVGPAGPCGPF